LLPQLMPAAAVRAGVAVLASRQEVGGSDRNVHAPHCSSKAHAEQHSAGVVAFLA
jgi:hypothetical protein